jgi:hypothetical protein
MKRQIIPPSSGDRIVASLGLLCLVLAIAFRIVAPDYGLTILSSFLLGTVEQSGNTEEYSKIISEITAIGSQLSNLSGFLERERARVADTEATVQKLNEERAQLEPVVLTQRQAVEAILSAHVLFPRMTYCRLTIVGGTTHSRPRATHGGLRTTSTRKKMSYR